MFLRSLLMFVCFFGLISQASSQSDVESLVTATSESSKELNKLAKDVASLTDIEYYKDWEAVNPTTQDVIKVSDLDEKDKLGFFLYQAELLNDKLAKINNEIKTYNVALKALELPLNADEKMVENKTKGLEYITNVDNFLTNQRSTLAKNHEKLLEEALITFKDDAVFLKEVTDYFNKLKKNHDAQNLIDRTKKSKTP